MEILFLCHRIPYPPDKGDKIRSHAILTYLAKRHKVHLACFVDDPADFAHTETVRRIAGGECLFVPLKPAAKWFRAARALLTGEPITTAYFGSAAIASWVNTIVATRALKGAVVFSSAMAPYLMDTPGFDPAHAVLDLVDVDSDKWRQYAAAAHGLERWIFGREASLLLRFERAAARRFGATILVSPFEAQSFAAMAPESAERIVSIANGVDLKRFSPGNFANPFAPGEIPVVMTGRMDYRPNADGAKWFAEEVMPLIMRSVDQARFYAVGSNPPSALSALAGPNVVITGITDDVRPYIQHATAIVAPLRIARGVQNKVLEAMAMARPVVATPEATRALGVMAGVDLWVESDPAKFATAVIAAIQGSDRARVAISGRTYVERQHNWERNLAALDDLLTQLNDDSAGADIMRPKLVLNDEPVRAPITQTRRTAAGAER